MNLITITQVSYTEIGGWWCGSLEVGRWTCDWKVVGSNPGSDAAAQPPWASCSHPVALARSLQHIEVKLHLCWGQGDHRVSTDRVTTD